MWRVRTVAAWAFVLGGCATVATGTTQLVTIDSEPRGARCELLREGRNIGTVTTPGPVRVDKSQRNIDVACRADGYEGSGTIRSDLAAAYAGNLLIGGAVGLAVDLASGAATRYDDLTFITLAARPGVTAPAAAAPAVMAAPAPPPVPAVARVSEFPAPIGQTFRDTIEIGAIQVPLPDGTWELAGKGVREAGSNYHAVTLVRIEQGRLWGFTRIWTAFRPIPGGGYSAFTSCQRTDVLFTGVNANVDHGDQDCWLVNHNVIDGPASPTSELHVRQTRMYLESRGVAVPGTMINATHRVASATNFVTVWYQVNPEFFGFPPGPGGPWRASAWHRDRIAADAKRAALADAIRKTTEDYHGYLRQGFDHRLSGFSSRAIAVARASSAGDGAALAALR